MQLPEALQKQKQEFARKASEEVVSAMAAETEELKKCGIVENCLGVGDTAPDFTLQDHHGDDVHLYDRLQQQPVILAFFRGDW